MSYPPNGKTFRERFAAMLQTIAYHKRYQHKHLARLAGATDTKTVANWLSGANTPSGEHLVNLMGDPDICEAILQMIRPDGPLSEDRRDEIWRALIGEE